MRICRLDAFLQGYDVKFLEFNADSPAGVGYTDILFEGLRTTIDLERVRQEFDTAYTPILPELIATLRDAYEHVRATRPDLPERPRLALVDSADSPSIPEFRIICAAAEAAGLSALHATLDDVAYDGTTLRVKDEPVHLVYRRALLEDLDQSDLVAAARDGRDLPRQPVPLARRQQQEAVRAVPGPPLRPPDRGRRGGRHPRDDPVDADPASRPRHLRRLEDRPPAVRRRQPREARAQAGVGLRRARRRARDGDARGGMGARSSPSTRDSADFIVQEYVPVPEEMFPTVEDGHVQMRLKRFNINPFGIGGRYAGSITRISDRAVINVSAGGGLLPSVIGRHKRRLLAEDEDESEVLREQTP